MDKIDTFFLGILIGEAIALVPILIIIRGVLIKVQEEVRALRERSRYGAKLKTANGRQMARLVVGTPMPFLTT